MTLLTLTVVGAAQDPSGRPTPSSTKRPKKPTKPKEVPSNTVVLTLMTQPAECQVFINGEDRGKTDSEGKLVINKLPGGHYTVEVRKPGFTTVSRGFEAGTEQPTLVFKLIASTEGEVKRFESLVASGKLTKPDDPNAVDAIKEMSSKFPDRPEIASLRANLFQKLMDIADAAAKATVSAWRTTSDEVIVRGHMAAAGAVELKDDDSRARAYDLYLEGAHLFRTWQLSLGSKPAEPGGKGIQELKPGHPEDWDGAKLNDARLNFENAAQIQSGWAPPLYQAGTVLLLLKDYLAAQAAFVKAIQRDPSWAAPHTGLAAALGQLGKNKEAIEEYQKAIQLDPGSSAAYAGMGLALAVKKQSKDAAKQIDKSIELDPTSALPHLDRGILLSQSKKKKEQEEALEELLRAVKMNANNFEFPNSIAEPYIADLKAKLASK
jgi:tetratricopeptide (TPR) repeat protein